jgi:hypothetical protein
MIPYRHRIGGPDPFDPEFTPDGTGNDLSIVCLHSIPTASGFYDGPFIQSIKFDLKIHISDVSRIFNLHRIETASPAKSNHLHGTQARGHP